MFDCQCGNAFHNSGVHLTTTQTITNLFVSGYRR